MRATGSDEFRIAGRNDIADRQLSGLDVVLRDFLIIGIINYSLLAMFKILAKSTYGTIDNLESKCSARGLGYDWSSRDRYYGDALSNALFAARATAVHGVHKLFLVAYHTHWVYILCQLVKEYVVYRIVHLEWYATADYVLSRIRGTGTIRGDPFYN